MASLTILPSTKKKKKEKKKKKIKKWGGEKGKRTKLSTNDICEVVPEKRKKKKRIDLTKIKRPKRGR